MTTYRVSLMLLGERRTLIIRADRHSRIAGDIVFTVGQTGSAGENWVARFPATDTISMVAHPTST